MSWNEILVSKVIQLGRRKVEADTGISKTTLSQVLNKKYPGNLENIEAKVLATYTEITVQCPVIGVIPTRRCYAEQVRPFSSSNPQRVKLFRTCKSCPNNRTRTNEPL
jgi:hypothetical protein